MRIFQERKVAYAVEGPYEDQMRLTTGDRKTMDEALEAAREFEKEMPIQKLRLVKTVTIVYTEILPYPQRHSRCPKCATK
jgi:hypothetical protein